MPNRGIGFGKTGACCRVACQKKRSAFSLILFLLKEILFDRLFRRLPAVFLALVKVVAVP